jgi:phosphoglycerate dehydrogenase-like enzyme
MATHSLLVLNDPAAPHLAALRQLPPDTRVSVGDHAGAFAGIAPETDVLVIGAVPRSLVEEVFPTLPRLKWVHSLAAGLDTVLFPELVESPLPLTNSRGVFANSLAEFAIGGMLWFAKDFHRLRRQQSEHRWEKFGVAELRGHTLGVIGHGAIGRATMALASAFGMKVRGLGRRHTPEQLHEVLRSADYLLIAAPLTGETLGMIGEAELRMLKPSCVLVNLGRGPIVAEEPFIEALRESRIRGAVLDVYDTEPLPPGHAFWSLENVLLSPHCADNTLTWLDDAMALFIENFRRYDAGEPLLNLTDKRKGY